jgi:hypothetical protein
MHGSWSYPKETNHLNPNNQINTKSMSNEKTPNLTQQEMQQLAEAYARFSFLRNATIKQAKDDAEIRGLTEHMARTFIDHASEFIGCWFGVRNEYEPIIGLVAQVAERVCAVRAQHAQRAAAQQVTGDAQEESKIIPIKG